MDIDLELIKSISITSPSRIVLLVLDGLGGLTDPETGKSELETAVTPNLDALTSKGICGLIDPVAPGITPGSAPGHLALFGYNPVTYNIGRGILEATGIDFDLRPGDVAARGNFCTVDKMGMVIDRRAGRIPTEKSTELCKLLDNMAFDDVKMMVRPVREHRFVVVFRGDKLAPEVNDSDPQQLGIPPKAINTITPKAAKLATAANKFVAQAWKLLAKHHPANMILLRGFSQRPAWPTMEEVYKLKPAAIASYPMYRGLARLVGMKCLDTGSTFEEEIATLKQHYDGYDFFFIHVKKTDAAGEDGDFAGKVEAIEQIDSALPGLTGLNPDVLVVTGDHSTPALLKGHSWHPVPILLCARWCRPDRVRKFGETDCATGGLGRFPATQVMPLAMAHALKLTKFGA
ncbi:MAG: 2,3-bisphosphoglycerate-independent phosphoglycerate mutase [Chloroflexi bacterium]|nr:2,3-bisphosphoglycerate-independent phosphoglycerate mutase [Chloroflexota bacterium]